MSELEQRRSSVREWIRIAEQDLRVVEITLGDDPPLLEVALFHAQQVGEKYLKAFLVWQGSAFPKTHDLKALLELCLPFDPDLVALREACFQLSELAVEPRYPMPPPPVDLEQAREAEEDARLVREAIRSRLRAVLTAEQ